MNEQYTFTARVAERWPNEIQIVPDDPEAFLNYLARAQLQLDPYWHGPEIWVSVGSQRLVAASEGAEWVRYTVTKRGSRMYGIALEPIWE